MNPLSQTLPLYYEFFIPVAASATVLKFYVKKTSSGADCTLHLDVYDSADHTTLKIDNAAVSLTDDWVQFSSDSFTPSEAGVCRCVLKALDGSTTGDIGIDDLEIA
jgi:hypothetical protein